MRSVGRRSSGSAKACCDPSGSVRAAASKYREGTLPRNAAAIALLAALAALPAAAATLDQRLAEVAKSVDDADTLFAEAKKGHLPSLEAINAEQARLDLAKELLARAQELAGSKKWQAGANLDAAGFLAAEVHKASEH